MKRRDLFVAAGAAMVAPAAAQAASDEDDETIVDYLFVQMSKAGVLSETELKLDGINPSTLYFSDRPERIVGRVTTQEFIENWAKGSDSFKSDPPNAVLALHDAGQPIEAVLVLSSPRTVGDTLLYSIEILQGKPASFDGGASLFIDLIGRPATPLSFAGGRRRTRRRVRRRWIY